MDAAKEIYSTAQAAAELGILPATLRTWKSRKESQLQENVHWFKQDNQTFWTPQGLEALKQIQPSVADREDETTSVAVSETTSVAVSETTSVASDPLQRYQSLADAVADAVAPQIVQRIDEAVMQRVKDAIATPPSATECVAILTKFGLAPANPNALLGSSVAGYLTETPDN